MEDRVAGQGPRPGLALIALVGILVITAAWWALALWPAGAVEPEWLARTRAACFGSVRGGLPHAGGWVLLIGEPIGMLGFLLAVWGDPVKRDVAWVMRHRLWRFAGAAVVVLALAGVAAASVRVARAAGVIGGRTTPDAGIATRVDRRAPDISLVDQHGTRVSFADYRDREVLLTFAFGHCATVCPAIVHGLRHARNAAGRSDVPLVVITVDPWRDSPDRLPTIARAWQLGEQDRVLSGSITEVQDALKALGIGGLRNESTGDVDHVATVLLLDRQGLIRWRLDGGWQGAIELLRAL